MIKKRIIFISILLISLGFIFAACSTITPTESTNKILSGNFNSIVLNGDFGKISIKNKLAEKNSISLTGSADNIKSVTTEIKENTLYINSNNKSLSISIDTKSIDRLAVNGTADITVTEINTENFFLVTDGATKINLQGKTNFLSLTTSGANDIEAKELDAINVRLKAKGNNNISITANKVLEPKISGFGAVTYYGDPKIIDKDLSLFSSIQKGKQ